MVAIGNAIVDVIAMVTAGYPATVAPLGTALTEEQLGLLWKMADEPILCFDGDNAGRRAASRAACTAGNNSAIKIPMIAITISSSIRVKPSGRERGRIVIQAKGDGIGRVTIRKPDS